MDTTNQHYLKWKRNRITTTIVYLCTAFFCGFEYTAILVSLLYYLMKYFDRETAMIMYGVCIAITFVPGVLAGLVGKLVDRSGKMKQCMCILLTIIGIGNIMYSIYFSVWFLIIGRFFVGFKLCLRSAMAGELVRWYEDEKQRDQILFYYQLLFSFGFIIGPATGILFVDVNFSIGHWDITQDNFIGIFLAIASLVILIAAIFLVHNTQHKASNKDENKNTKSTISFNDIIQDPDIVITILSNGVILFASCSFDLCCSLVGRNDLKLSLLQLSILISIGFGVFTVIAVTWWSKFLSNGNSLRGLMFCLFCQCHTGVLLLMAKFIGTTESILVRMILILMAYFFNSIGGVPCGVAVQKLLFRMVPKESACYIEGIRIGVCFPIFSLSGFFLTAVIYKEMMFTIPIICSILLLISIPLLARKKRIFARMVYDL